MTGADKILVYFLIGLLVLILLSVIFSVLINSSVDTLQRVATDATAGINATLTILSNLLTSSELQTDAAIAGSLYAVGQASVRYGGSVVTTAGSVASTVASQTAKLGLGVASATGSAISSAGSKSVGLLGNMVQGLTTMGGSLIKNIMPIFEVVIAVGFIADIYDLANVTVQGAQGKPFCST